MCEGDWGTHTAAITYYYAYKSNRFLSRLGFGRIEVKNFQSAVAMGEGALFFLTREPSKDLVLPCMAPLSELSEPRKMGFSSMYEVLELVRIVGESEDISAANFAYWYTCMRIHPSIMVRRHLLLSFKMDRTHTVFYQGIRLKNIFLSQTPQPTIYRWCLQKGMNSHPGCKPEATVSYCCFTTHQSLSHRY